MSPETFLSLADEYANFIMFKDTSGEDRVARALADASGVSHGTRIGEGVTIALAARQPTGNYDGFLLSTATTALQLSCSKSSSSARVGTRGGRSAVRSNSPLRRGCFRSCQSVYGRHPFTNANKAIDHLQRLGGDFRNFPTPMLISGASIPMEPS